MTNPNKGNPTSPDGALSSIRDNQWEVHGQAFYISSSGTLLALNFYNRNQLAQMTQWAKKSGCTPLQPDKLIGSLMQSIALINPVDIHKTKSQKGGKPHSCGHCGSSKKLLRDQQGRGWYCAERVAGGYCGWQSWHQG